MSATLSAYRNPSGVYQTQADERGSAASDDTYPNSLDDRHTRLVEWFEEAEMVSLESREYAMRDRAYLDGDQWTTPEREALRKRGQPEITINYIRRKISLLCGMERRARTDPKAFPRDPTEDDRADAATQALRYLADNNDFQITRSAVYENMLVEGFGGIEMGLEDDGKGGADVTITHIGWERIWFDPHSRDADFSDARYKGLVIWMDRDQLDEMYPDADEGTVADSFSHYAGSYDDRPREMVAWTDTKRQRCRVVQAHWLEKGVWWSATFSRAGFLTNPQRSPFKDRKGKSACSLILQAAYIDQENRRYGVVRDLISEQDEINKRRSKALHLLSVRSVIAEKGAVTDVDAARREVARPDGYVEITPGMKFEVADGGQLASGQFQLLEHATREMQQSGPNASLSGTNEQELSGRAILANQAGGMAQNEPLADALRMWSRTVYEMAWMALREYWTAGKWVRVTDDLGSTRWVGINRPVTLQDELAAMPQAQRAQVMQSMQPPLQPGDPRLTQVIRIENDVTDLDVDITIDEGQDVPTMAAENFQTLVQLASMQPGLIPGEVLIAASSLKNKDQLLEMMKEKQQQAAQQQAQVAPIAAAHAQAQVAKLQGDAAAQFALAKERQINAVHGVADIHTMHNALVNPPPDAPSAPGANAMPPMPPGMQDLHNLADLRGKHAKAAADEAKAAHTRHQAVGTIADTHNTMVTTNRLARTPIPQPPAPGASSP